MSTTVSKILTCYLVQSYSATDVFTGKFMKFSEAVTGGVLWKKLFLRILKYLQESCRPATLLKRDSNAGVFLWILWSF